MFSSRDRSTASGPSRDGLESRALTFSLSPQTNRLAQQSLGGAQSHTPANTYWSYIIQLPSALPTLLISCRKTLSQPLGTTTHFPFELCSRRYTPPPTLRPVPYPTGSGTNLAHVCGNAERSERLYLSNPPETVRFNQREW